MDNNQQKDIADFTGLRITLASPEQIKEWGRCEVTKPETINYRTLRPEKDGLFCERIFGPTKDFECYCGKYKRIRYRGVVCDKCGVEVTTSRVRRERMGYISLAAPCVHAWFFRGAPSKLSLILDMPPKSLEAVVYFAQHLVNKVDEDKRKEALNQIEKLSADRLKEIKDEAEEKIAAIKKEETAETAGIKKKFKGKEEPALVLQEIDLKIKQKIQTVRSDQAIEESKAETIVQNLADKVKTLHFLSLLTEDEYLRLAENGLNSFFKVGMGAEGLLEALSVLDFDQLSKSLRQEAAKANGPKYLKLAKRLRVIEGMRKAGTNPAWTVLKILPVIPPDLRPMVQLAGGRFATSDLNDLYRRVINRNNRLKHLIVLGAPEIILRNEKRMLQEAVDALIDSSQKVTQGRRRAGQNLRSLSDMLRGKQGRFRQNLLGKRVDYSGRSVIVVGPELKLTECGLPKEMALEMFKPYLLREMIIRGLAPNVRSAKNILEHRPLEVYDILEEITRNHPVLLNRAPTLHKLGIQAFFPILTDDNAIRVHPCVCAGYNADFDGDQMAVHIPLSQEAQEEAINLMMVDQNLLRPADGSPVALPNREMALGIFYLTSLESQELSKDKIFGDPEEVVFAYQAGKLSLRRLVKVKMDGKTVETTAGRLIFNEILPPGLRYFNEPVKSSTIKTFITRALQIYSNKETVKLIDALKDLGFAYATTSAISLSVSDCVILPNKDKIIGQSNREVAQIEKNLEQELITVEEKKRLVREIWMETTDSLADLTWQSLPVDSPIKMFVESGATKAGRDQIKQLSAMQGLVVDPLGRIVDLPTKSNFREGLNVFEYITSARGSRKGLTDTAIKTADAGYLTRRLVDVAHEVLVREEDCGTDEGLEITRQNKSIKPFVNRVLGRFLAKDVIAPKGKKVLIKKNELLTEANAALLESEKIEQVVVRSPLTCKTKYGICSQCYGWDMGNKKPVDIGNPVGVVAAQSIGEPGTQLTLRTKHTAGVVGLDVTQGLPRVEELFEIRIPKSLSPLAEIDGKVSIIETDEGYKVRVKGSQKPVEEREYLVPLISSLLVNEGEMVLSGTQLASGSLDIKEILTVKGLRAAQEYLIREIQTVYESQGIPINDKHFETIVRKMSEKVRVRTVGDTILLPGELINKNDFDEENRKAVVEKGEPATAQIVISGITQASLLTESWLSAASFQETTSVLTDAALNGKEDHLVGLKENVIIGRLIPVTPERARLKG